MEENEEPTPVVGQPLPPSPEPAPGPPGDCITQASADNGKVIEGAYVVQYKSEEAGIQSGESSLSILSNARIPEGRVRFIYAGKFRAFSARLDQSQVELLKKDPAVQSIEPDRIVSIVSCSTAINEQTVPWGIERVGYGDGTGKTAWIIDTGVDLDHPDLNVDANRSKSFITGTTPDDDHGHGTHVAGTVGAKNNYTGVRGVAANAKIVALKVMDSGGKGNMSAVIAAVNHVSQHGRPGDVVNMSIGGETSKILDQAVTDAANKGIYFAVAAGNQRTEANLSSPARVNHPNIFTVSAMDDQDTWASFSNYGSDCVDYCAPGVRISSTTKNGGYATMSGTSMATPHVAGLLLLKGKNIVTNGYVKDDPDGKPDPIAHK